MLVPAAIAYNVFIVYLSFIIVLPLSPFSSHGNKQYKDKLL